MIVARFTESGITRFSRVLDSYTSDSPEVVPSELLTDPSLATIVAGGIEISPQPHATRFELAEYLNRKFSEASFDPDLDDKLLWAWLGAAYFEAICPRDRSGKLKPGARVRWIPDLTNYRRYYRHLIAGPYSIFRAHSASPDIALAVLCQPPGRPGDVVEQLASRQTVVSNATVMRVATELFYDPGTKSLRRGSGGKGAGSARRLVDVLDQFDLTWDLGSVPPDVLQGMLPPEFKPASAGGR